MARMFSEEQIAMANSVDIASFLQMQGEALIKSGIGLPKITLSLASTLPLLSVSAKMKFPSASNPNCT